MHAKRIFGRPESGTQPELAYTPYASTAKRAPRAAPIEIFPTATETTRPFLPKLGSEVCDLTCQFSNLPQGERIIVSGQVRDEDGQPVVGALLELWQANAAGRYRHPRDTHDAPLDPHFQGSGRVLTDATGSYRFITIKPGAYPWRNHPNAWRPAHLHFSVIGDCLLSRLVTQMYFPGDPLLPHDPIFMSVADVAARQRLVSILDWSLTVPELALGYRFDVVLGGRAATPADPHT